MKTICASLAGVMAVAFFCAATAEATGKVVTIGTQVTGHSVPWCGHKVALRFQCLWKQSDIGYAGYINAVEFRFSSGNTSGTFNACRVLLCHTTKDVLSGEFDANYGGKTPVTVLNKSEHTVSGTEWVDVGINPGKFYYNNSDNLLMEIRWYRATYTNIYCKIYNVNGGRCYAYDEGAEYGMFYDQGQYIRLHVGTMAGVETTSLGRVKALFR
jgi:hypothetical protein